MTTESQFELPHDDHPLDDPEAIAPVHHAHHSPFDRPTDYFTEVDGEVLPPSDMGDVEPLDGDVAKDELEDTHPWIDHGAAVLTLADYAPEVDQEALVQSVGRHPSNSADTVSRAMPQEDGAVEMPSDLKAQVAALRARNAAVRKAEGPLLSNAISSPGFDRLELEKLQAKVASLRRRTGKK